MSPFEIYELQIQLLDQFTNVFEVWLGFTFAAIVAFHFGASLLSKNMLRACMALYVFASILFLTRYIALTVALASLTAELASMDRGPIVPPYLGAPIALMIVILFIAGTTTTIWYALQRARSN